MISRLILNLRSLDEEPNDDRPRYSSRYFTWVARAVDGLGTALFEDDA